MKKFIMCLIAVSMLAIAGCSSSGNEASDLTMDKIIQAFNNSGEDVYTGIPSEKKEGVDINKKPQYAAIKAKDGIMFNLGLSSVKIYEYKSSDDLKKAMDKYGDIFEGDSIKGRFLLETNNERAKEIFKSIK
ncbi:hypothetical protein KIH86_17635 [Paenibacillus sp. HN-1]|uniref:hypothetical protein n=1 Tax=Paenibacillus TaxID=44249 RepID=UPI001CAA2273|nr:MULTISPECIES: hypothetical protein [Paenibacillus]MBY9078309.1 hypothetical protein [Paenibacillus sp. CGMCC 1.18879]MBY9086032.1 hypothetical protein [Paenibacillus sinensis]